MRCFIFIFLVMVYSVGYGQYPDGNKKITLGNFNETLITALPDTFQVDTFRNWHKENLLLHTAFQNSSYYDSISGKLIFSNTMRICTSAGDTIKGSEKLMDSILFDRFQESGVGGFPQMQVILPLGNQRYGILYNSVADSNIINNLYAGSFTLLRYAELDMSRNNGKGEVIKIQVVAQDTFLVGHLTATLHANGKDWWILVPHFNNAGYHTYLLTPDSLYTYPTQYIGLPCKAAGKSEFSPQGNKYAMIDVWQYAQLFDFDRCSGLLSNVRYFGDSIFGVWEYNDSTILPRKFKYWSNGQKAGYINATFSPSGRYIYVSSYSVLSQFNTEAVIIDTSVKVIAYYDRSYYYLTIDVFNDIMLASNGQILIGCRSGWRIAGQLSGAHVIRNPDLPGVACNFEKFGVYLILSAENYALPQNPSYFTSAVPSADNQQNQTIYYCAGDSITLSRKHYPYSSYKWYDSNTTLATDTLRYALRPTGNKTIYVALHDSTCSCGNRTDTIRFIAVNDTAIYRSYHTTICSTDSITIGNSYPNSRYAWYRDSTLISTADSITATAAATYIQHIIDTTLLCVTHIDTFYIHTIDCDTIPQLPIGIHFFPNPANDYIEYTINDSTLNINELQLNIIAVSGATVIQKYITNATGKIDITNLASGVYILSLTSNKQVKYRKKWVVW